MQDWPAFLPYQQVEQDRTSHVPSYYGELAWETADQHRGNVNLIGNTNTKTGLTIQAELDTGSSLGLRSATRIWRKTGLEKAEFHKRLEPSHCTKGQMISLFLRGALVPGQNMRQAVVER